MQSLLYSSKDRDIADASTKPTGQDEETTLHDLNQGGEKKLKNLSIEQKHSDHRRITLDKVITDVGANKVVSIFDVEYMMLENAGRQVILLQDDSYICTCILLQNSGIVCRHFFHLMHVDPNFRYHITIIPKRWYKETMQDMTNLDVSIKPFCSSTMQMRGVSPEYRIPDDTYMTNVSRVFSSLVGISQADQESISRKRSHAELVAKTKQLVSLVEHSPDQLGEAMSKVDEAIFVAKGDSFIDDPDVLRRSGPPTTKRRRSNLERPLKPLKKGQKTQKCSVCVPLHLPSLPNPNNKITLIMVKKIAPKSSGNVITNFIRQEITAPEKRAGNTSIAISLTVFGLAVTFLRSLGDMLGV
ncbi:hypothetical protein BGX26_005865 [Mortierella sp. AD094]|nr:hypothetical protein BGX26_005865 [Mortierella sp. AD094]